MADSQHNGSAHVRAEEIVETTDLSALVPGNGAAAAAAVRAQVSDEHLDAAVREVGEYPDRAEQMAAALGIGTEPSLLAAVLLGAETRPGEDQPDFELDMLPGAVDANLARANDHLDRRWRTGRREELVSQFQRSMRFARQLHDVVFTLKAEDATIGDQEKSVLNLSALTFYAGFLAGTDAAEASYLRRTSATALQIMAVVASELKDRVAAKGACIDLPTLDALMAANDETWVNFHEVGTLSTMLARSSEFQSIWEIALDALTEAGWKQPEGDAYAHKTPKVDFDLMAARLIRVGYMAARAQMSMPVEGAAAQGGAR